MRSVDTPSSSTMTSSKDAMALGLCVMFRFRSFNEKKTTLLYNHTTLPFSTPLHHQTTTPLDHRYIGVRQLEEHEIDKYNDDTTPSPLPLKTGDLGWWQGVVNVGQ